MDLYTQWDVQSCHGDELEAVVSFGDSKKQQSLRVIEKGMMSTVPLPPGLLKTTWESEWSH
jgi:hypothetical protein